MAAISKGWSLFSAAVVGATKVVSENVIQPGVEKVTDPNFQASVKGYVSEAQKRAMVAGGAANTWSKQQFGVDVAGREKREVGVLEVELNDSRKGERPFVEFEVATQGRLLVLDTMAGEVDGAALLHEPERAFDCDLRSVMFCDPDTALRAASRRR